MGTPSSDSVSSADRTTIAFDRYGDGRPVILIGGAYNDRLTVASVAQAISSGELAAVTYDRRGRGASTNNDSEFAPERELEDLAAMIEALGGSVSVFGHSSGAVLALEAAMQRLPIERLAVYEPPYMVDGTRPLPPDDLNERLSALVRAGRRDDAVGLFSTEAVGLPSAMVEAMRAGPMWGWLTALAHTLPYDVAVHHGYRLPTARLGELELPLLALDGSESFPGSARPLGQWRRRPPGRGISRSKVRTTALCSTQRHSGRRSSSSSADPQQPPTSRILVAIIA
ncbi:MAG: alpha/beta fold hydrolase [Solirubrobacteraceae bacterium]